MPLLDQSTYLFGKMFMNRLNIILASLLLTSASIAPTFASTKNLGGSSNNFTANDNSQAYSQVLPHQTQKLASTPNLIPSCNVPGETAPCITPLNANQSGNKIIFRWGGAGDFYNVRYPVSGGETQVINRSGSFTITNVQPNRIYKISAQACVSHFLSKSSCTNWQTRSFTTR
jgi:hypothetical protein